MLKQALACILLVFLVFSNLSISGENEEKQTIGIDSNLYNENKCITDFHKNIIIDEHFETSWQMDPDMDYEAPIDPVYGFWDVDGINTETRSGYPHFRGYMGQMPFCCGYDFPYDGTYCAGAWWSSYPQDEWLKTPELDLTYVINLELSFYGIWYWDSPGDDHTYIKVSTDNETTWTVLADLLQDPQFEQGTGGPGGYGWCWNEYQVVLNLC